jgi:hypothetical protein
MSFSDMNEEPEGGQEESGADTLNLVMAAPVMIERRRLEDDEDRPEISIIGSFLDGKLIARCAGDPEWTPEDDGDLFSVPRQLVYQASELEDKTIRAQLLALIPAKDIPREPWQPEPDEDAPPAFVLLGIVVRLPGDRKEPDFPRECLSHFMSIVGGNAEPVVDRILKSL